MHSASFSCATGFTVMFSDLVGSTALSARMDPEDLREVILAYEQCVAETVRRFVAVSHMCAQTYAIENETASMAKHTMANINAATPVLSRPSALWPWELRSSCHRLPVRPPCTSSASGLGFA
jgi:hypothetical protein